MTNHSYNYCITPEAANDIPSGLEDPKRKFHHASLESYENEKGETKQLLYLHLELVGYEFGKDYNMYPVICMPIEGVIDMLKFSMRTMADAYHLTHEERLPSWNVDPAPVKA